MIKKILVSFLVIFVITSFTLRYIDFTTLLVQTSVFVLVSLIIPFIFFLIEMLTKKEWSEKLYQSLYIVPFIITTLIHLFSWYSEVSLNNLENHRLYLTEKEIWEIGYYNEKNFRSIYRYLDEPILTRIERDYSFENYLKSPIDDIIESNTSKKINEEEEWRKNILKESDKIELDLNSVEFYFDSTSNSYKVK